MDGMGLGMKKDPWRQMGLLGRAGLQRPLCRSAGSAAVEALEKVRPEESPEQSSDERPKRECNHPDGNPDTLDFDHLLLLPGR
jgi:hypothetical protein